MSKKAPGAMTDVCVIGTGAGGGVWIDACTRAGLDVVALERGPHLGPADFIQHDEFSNTHRNVGFLADWSDTVREDANEKAFAWCGAYRCPYASHACMNMILTKEVVTKIEEGLNGI